MIKDNYFIAVDGGGTKTEAVLFTPSGEIVRRLVGEGANPNTKGTDNSISILKDIIDKTAQGVEITGIFIGCAGCGTKSNAQILSSALKAYFPDAKLGLVSDILTASRSITDGNAICCIAGTGCTVAAVCENDFTLFSGTGPLLCDTGSGYSIGKAALVHAVEQRDFGCIPDSLTLAAENKAGGKIRDNIPFIYKKSVPYIAQFAQTVFEQAATSRKAEEIINENAVFLSSLINKVSSLYPQCHTAALTGSVFRNDLFRQMVTDKLIIPHTYSENPQVTGAAVLCLEICGITSPDFRESFTKNYSTYIAGETNA